MKLFSVFGVVAIVMACFFVGCTESGDEEASTGLDNTNNNNNDNSSNNNNTGSGNTKGLKGVDIAISTEANWMEQDTADREMGILVDQINGKVKSVQVFPPEMQNQLATWMTSRINDNKLDVLILCGVLPNSIYKAGNEQPNGSIAEKFLDAGNMIVNTGDYMFFIGSGRELNNGEEGLQNISDVQEFIFWVGGFMTPTNEGANYLPSLTEFSSDRSFNLDVPVNPWVPEVVFAQVNDGGKQADPIVVKNTSTNGRIAIFYQSEWQEDLPRGQVMSEFILNWLPTILPKP
jgi:hypothetical protein